MKIEESKPSHGVYKCSNCGNYLDFHGVNAGRGDTNYCPNCGARMDEEMQGRTKCSFGMRKQQ